MHGFAQALQLLVLADMKNRPEPAKKTRSVREGRAYIL
jgi:hypothetical protein